jgi:glutamate racemase
MLSPSPSAAIGVFDSGVGGLSVLRALRTRLPAARLHYLADSAYAPYGDRSVEDVIERSRRVCAHLLDQGAGMIVVACNTATTAAIGALRGQWPRVPFVGVEPGVKPAAAASRNRRIGVLATRRTIASERLRTLVEQHAADCHVVLQACPGLVDVIERGNLDDEALRSMLTGFCAPLRDAQVDTVVLGCTHYPFVADALQAVLGPEVKLVDTAEAVSQRALHLAATLQPATPLPQRSEPLLRLQTTGEAATLAGFAERWLGLHTPAEVVDV